MASSSKPILGEGSFEINIGSRADEETGFASRLDRHMARGQHRQQNRTCLQFSRLNPLRIPLRFLLPTLVLFTFCFCFYNLSVWRAKVLDELPGGTRVPGNAELRYCDRDEELRDGLVLEHVDMSPYPPVPGQNVTVIASGSLSHPITEGATVDVHVRLGWVTLFNRELDLCDEAENILNLKCPIPRGPIDIVKEFSIPEAIPPGEFKVTADIKNEDGSTITCLMGKIKFH